jgi:hypothetical protein
MSRGQGPLPRSVLACLTALVLVAIGGAPSAWAWGDLGHKIVCQIALQELNDTARAEVIRLRRRANEHFINVPRTSNVMPWRSASSRPL